MAAGAQLRRAAEPLLCRAGGSPVGGGSLWSGDLEQGQPGRHHAPHDAADMRCVAGAALAAGLRGVAQGCGAQTRQDINLTMLQGAFPEG